MKSQCELILDYMSTYGSITQREAVKKFDCYRLSARIYDLRQKGYEIIEKRERNKRTKVQYSRYALSERDVQRLHSSAKAD